jgi:aminoglycoside 3-N-acetyltransferase
MTAAATYSDTEMTERLTLLGVQQSDCLFVHSSLRALGKFVPKRVPEGFNGLLQVLLEAAGKMGTIIVPTFNFSFCKGKAYDLQNTPCEGMGAFSEFVRKHPSSIRSRHPFQSVAAVGALAREIGAAQSRTAFSSGSAFDIMLRNNCKILFFGVNFVETFVHVAEERANVSYRFWKTFTADFIDNGVSNEISVDFFARKLDLVPEPKIDNDKLGRIMREKKIIKTETLGAGRISICSSVNLVNELTARLLEDPYCALTARPTESMAPAGRTSLSG